MERWGEFWDIDGEEENWDITDEYINIYRIHVCPCARARARNAAAYLMRAYGDSAWGKRYSVNFHPITSDILY